MKRRREHSSTKQKTVLLDRRQKKRKTKGYVRSSWQCYLIANVGTKRVIKRNQVKQKEKEKNNRIVINPLRSS